MKRKEFLTVAARAAAGTMLLSSKSIVLLAIAVPAATLAQQGMPGGMGMGRGLYPGRPNAQIGFPDRNGRRRRLLEFIPRHAWLQPDRPGHDAWCRDVLLFCGRPYALAVFAVGLTALTRWELARNSRGCSMEVPKLITHLRPHSADVQVQPLTNRVAG